MWSLPAPGGPAPSPVDVRLSDYGVSRAVLPSGAKGLAGTVPFIAPEIIQHNGEEPYTEKVGTGSGRDRDREGIGIGPTVSGMLVRHDVRRVTYG